MVTKNAKREKKADKKTPFCALLNLHPFIHKHNATGRKERLNEVLLIQISILNNRPFLFYIEESKIAGPF